MNKVIIARKEDIIEPKSGILYFAEDTQEVIFKTDITGELKEYNFVSKPSVEYNFESYSSDGNTKYAEGKVKTTGNEALGKTEVIVLENDNFPEWVGLKFWITSNAVVGNDLYLLYDADGKSVGVKVKLVN